MAVGSVNGKPQSTPLASSASVLVDSSGIFQPGNSFTQLSSQSFTSSGAFTYTPTSGMKFVIVELCGGGGGSATGLTFGAVAGRAGNAGIATFTEFQ